MEEEFWKKPREAWRAIYGICLAAIFSAALIASVVVTVDNSLPSVDVTNEPVPVNQDTYFQGESISTSFALTQRKDVPFTLSRAVVCEDQVAPLPPVQFPSRLTGENTQISFKLNVLVVESISSNIPSGDRCWLSFSIQVDQEDVKSFRSENFSILPASEVQDG